MQAQDLAQDQTRARSQNQVQSRPQQVFRSPILVVDFEALFRASAQGRHALQELEAERQELARDIAAIDEKMAREERELTRQRSDLPAGQFRVLADAFDEKVQRLRAEQDDRAAALNRRRAEEQLNFRQKAAPVLGQLMLDTGALIVVEKRSLVIFNEAIDVTDLIAERMDDILAGSGTDGTENSVNGAEPVTADPISTD